MQCLLRCLLNSRVENFCGLYSGIWSCPTWTATSALQVHSGQICPIFGMCCSSEAEALSPLQHQYKNANNLKVKHIRDGRAFPAGFAGESFEDWWSLARVEEAGSKSSNSPITDPDGGPGSALWQLCRGCAGSTCATAGSEPTRWHRARGLGPQPPAATRWAMLEPRSTARPTQKPSQPWNGLPAPLAGCVHAAGIGAMLRAKVRGLVRW